MDTALATDLSRAKSSVAALFQILRPALAIGLSWFLVFAEALWLETDYPYPVFRGKVDRHEAGHADAGANELP
jgi:hypothetical protein